MSFLIKIFYLLLSISTVFTISEYFPDAMTDAKWYSALGILIVVIFLLALYLLNYKERSLVVKYNFPECIEIITVIICTIQVLLFLLARLDITPNYQHTYGSFDTVTGFVSCISISMPLGIRLWIKMSKWKKVLFVICKLTCVMAIIIVESRTGILCVIMCGLMLFFRKLNTGLIWGILFFILAIIILFVFFKFESSQGRWFICCMTLKMISQKPLTGWGINGFEAHYMNIQADFFEKNENNENYIFADNILHPLNEFLNITVDFGFIGLGILILSIIFIIYINYHNRNEDICLGIQILVCIGILSMFSYPFDYPFSWLMLVFSLIIILKRFILSHSHLIGLILLCFLPIYGYSFFNKLSYILEYKQLYNKASYGMFDQVRYRYEQLYPYLKNDPRFLYNYASELNEIGEYEKALSVAIECRKILADYDLCLLIGDIAYNLNYLSIALMKLRKECNLLEMSVG
ncbi:MAG: O-antigen ligase family protein [Bacilli bacterium]|nr:O-antigen ligase family protein [Bacilli bacterium]MBP3921014.1 O-antigen ligase family protein [Bacilli bacterium]